MFLNDEHSAGLCLFPGRPGSGVYRTSVLLVLGYEAIVGRADLKVIP